ncbi:MAG: hypothetical protein EP298_01210 [Gammaproteobacteria bacterium]|nr:MAG: hypothetical protein EP298_01210 [Gammaproteobacteria bacterium]UTW41969.1 hypothetical protein KFE69_10720 [bacterium SCSIO 12844]
MAILNKLYTLIKREYWENKVAFLKAPLVLAFIILFIAFCSFSLFLYNGDEVINGMNQGNVSDLSTLSDGFVQNVFYVIASPLMLIMWLVVFNFFLGSLYNDRKDRSLLFWLSMPITHTESIIAKIIAGIFIAPIFTWVCIIITEFICLVLLTIVALILGIGPISHLWPVGSIVLVWVKMLFAFYIQGIWLFPLFAWCMLASAFAKRSPFLTAILPVILIMIIESLFFHTAYLSNAISMCFTDAVMVWGSLFESINYHDQIVNIQSGSFKEVLMNTHLLWGLIVGVIFISIAGLLRYRCFRFDRL